MADHFSAPTVQDVLAAIDQILGALFDPAVLDELIRGAPTSKAMIDLRWELFHGPRAPREIGYDWLLDLAARKRRLSDRIAAHAFHAKHDGSWMVEEPNGRLKMVRVTREPSLKEAAFANLISGLTEVWETAGLEVTVRKDDQKALNPRASPFVTFVHDLLGFLPQSYRRQSPGALASAISALRRRAASAPGRVSEKQNPT